MKPQLLFNQRAVLSAALAVLALSCLYAQWAVGADIADYMLLKGQRFNQTGPTTVSSPSTNGFIFESSVEASASGSVLSAVVILPNGTALVLNAEGATTFHTQDLLNTKNLLDARYPIGTNRFIIVTLNDVVNMPTLILPNDNFPGTPRVTNWVAAQLVDATADFTVRWITFTSGNSNDFIQFTVQDTMSMSNVFNSGGLGDAGALNGTNRFVTIPAGTLATGHVYRAQLTFLKVASLDTNSLPGATGLAGLFSETELTLSTQTNYTQMGIVTETLTNAEIGILYSATFAVTGGLPPYVFAPEKPLSAAFAGLTLHSTGRLSGIPSRPYNPSRKTANAKTTKFTLLVTDATEATVTRKFKFKIVEPLDIATNQLRDGTVSNGYRARLKASRGDKPYTWTKTVELPPGLTLDSLTGEITGTPTTNGVFTNLVIRVTDPLGGSKQKAFSLTIGEGRR